MPAGVSSAADHLLFPSFLQISLVSQEPVLFARSIADNISYGLTSASFESVVQAAQKANAHAFITELQDGYQTGTKILPITLGKALPREGRDSPLVWKVRQVVMDPSPHVHGSLMVVYWQLRGEVQHCGCLLG